MPINLVDLHLIFKTAPVLRGVIYYLVETYTYYIKDATRPPGIIPIGVLNK